VTPNLVLILNGAPFANFLPQVSKTMSRIRKVLKDRHVNYLEARNLLESNDDAEALLADPKNEAVEEDDFEPTLSEAEVGEEQKQYPIEPLLEQPVAQQPPR
jgi:hypothetical protein